MIEESLLAHALVGATPQGIEGRWSAGSRLEAEHFYSQSGVSFDSTGVGSLDAGDWLRYIDMTSARAWAESS
jgi:hypothetical protein